MTCTVPSNDQESASAWKISGSSCATTGSLTAAKHGVRLFSMLNTVNAEMGGIAALVQVNQSCSRNRRTAA
jgi:hypothetical protein